MFIHYRCEVKAMRNVEKNSGGTLDLEIILGGMRDLETKVRVPYIGYNGLSLLFHVRWNNTIYQLKQLKVKWSRYSKHRHQLKQTIR